MTDYRDPNYRDPARSDYRDDPNLATSSDSWSTATWGWIAGIAVVALVLIFAFSGGRDADRTATDTAVPPSTTGQRIAPPAPSSGLNTDAPAMNRPAPMAPATPPADPAR
jgi:hypothetical protein